MLTGLSGQIHHILTDVCFFSSAFKKKGIWHLNSSFIVNPMTIINIYTKLNLGLYYQLIKKHKAVKTLSEKAQRIICLWSETFADKDMNNKHKIHHISGCNNYWTSCASDLQTGFRMRLSGRCSDEKNNTNIQKVHAEVGLIHLTVLH